MPPPFLSMKFFDTRRFLKHRRVALRCFLFLWEKKISKQNRDTPLLCMSFFDIPNFFDTLKGFPQNVLATWDRIFSPENINSFPLINKLVSIPERSDTQKCFLTKFFVSVVWDGKSLIKPWCPPFPWMKIFYTRSFLKHKRLPKENCWHDRTKIAQQKTVISPSYASKFLMCEFFWNTEVFFSDVFRHSETKNWQYGAAFSSYAWNVSIKDFFWNTEGLRNNFFRHWESNKFRQNSDALPSYAQRFLHQVFFETQIGSHTNLMGTVRQKISARKSWHAIPPIPKLLFRTRNILKHKNVLWGSFSAAWGKKFCTENHDIPYQKIYFPLIHKLFSYQKISDA